MSDYSNIPSDKLAKMIALIRQNGSPGGTLFATTKSALETLRENGKEDDAAELEKQAGPNDIVCVKNGMMFLVDIDDVP
jgi:hypothetical protein